MVDFYHPQRSCRKVMFSQVCVKNSVHGGVSQHALGQTPPTRVDSPWTDTPWPDTTLGQTPPRTDNPPSSRRLLQWMVRILLECILVLTVVSWGCELLKENELWFFRKSFHSWSNKLSVDSHFITGNRYSVDYWSLTVVYYQWMAKSLMFMSVEPVSFNALQVCGRDGSAVMLAAKRSAGVAPVVNLKEYVIRTPLLSSNKAAPRGDVTRNPKQGYQWAHKKDSYSPRIKKKLSHSSTSSLLITRVLKTNF